MLAVRAVVVSGGAVVLVAAAAEHVISVKGPAQLVAENKRICPAALPGTRVGSPRAA